MYGLSAIFSEFIREMEGSGIVLEDFMEKRFVWKLSHWVSVGGEGRKARDGEMIQYLYVQKPFCDHWRKLDWELVV